MSDQKFPAAAATGEIPDGASGTLDVDPRAGAWGFANVPWLWGPRLRILFVMDGRVTVTWGEDDFGLGYVLGILRERFAWWVAIDVTTAHRGDVEPFEIVRWPVSIKVGPDMVGFRFTQDGFDIDEFDQVWFFGDEPGLDGNNPDLPDSAITDAKYRPLDNAELLIIADWMDRGGGVFATGDHAVLGASMCHRIPRVRRMRRWTSAQNVPPIFGDDRNETLVHAPAAGELGWEGDRWPQRIYPVLNPRNEWFGSIGSSPHPIMCARGGIIEHFPDHMHEGGLFDDDEVRLDDPLDIPGYERAEFPTPPPVATFGSGLVTGPTLFGDRPRPEVISYGLTSHGQAPRRFPMVGVYDGESVGLGRIVVDSTWHHWFSMNLVGFRRSSPGHYAGMIDYYRNIALWLATPAQRAWMLFAATWGTLVGSHPGAFDQALGIRGLGERVVDVIGRTAPQCIQDELVATVAQLPRRAPRDTEETVWMWTPSQETLNVTIIGAIASSLLPRAHHHIEERARGRETELDVDVVRRLSLEGVEFGRRRLLGAVTEGADIYREATAYLEEAEPVAGFGDVPIERLDEGWRDATRGSELPDAPSAHSVRPVPSTDGSQTGE